MTIVGGVVNEPAYTTRDSVGGARIVRIPGFVYLMGVLDGCHKIGRSSDPNGRLDEVGVNLPVALRIVHSIASENPYWLEKLLHCAYAQVRKGGEWFHLTAGDIAAIRRMSCVDGPDDLPPRFRPHTSARDNSDASLVNVKEYAVGLASTLARQLRWKHGRDLTARVAGFQLARLMVGAGFVRPDDLRDVSGEFALACGFKPAAVWSRFVKGWDAVLNPVGDDAFDRLVKAVAGMTNAEVSPHPGSAYLRVALLAWQLQLAADESGDPLADFIFPTTRIEKAFGVHRSSAASAVNALVDRGILVCTSPDYSFFYRKARRFRFVGSVTIGGGA